VKIKKTAAKSHFKKIIYNTFAQTFSRAIVLLISLLTTSILTRKLGVEDWGNYVFLTSFILLLVSVSDWGTQIIGVREISQAKNKLVKGQIIASVFRLRFFLALACFVVGVLAVLGLPVFDSLLLPALVGLFVVLLLSFDTNFEIVFQALLRMDLKGILDIGYSLLLLGFSLFALLSGWGLLGVIGSWFAARLVIVFAGWALASRLEILTGKPKKEHVVKIFKESLPTGALLLMFTAYDRGVDTFFLKYFWGEAEVGYYGLSYKIYGNLVIPAYFLANSLLPILSKKDSQFISLFKKGLVLAGLGSILLVLTAYFFAPLVVGLLGGSQFFASGPLLRILVFSIPFAYLNHILGYSLIALGRQVTSLKIGALGLIWNLILNFIYIPRFAAGAASWITVSTEGIIFIAYLLAFWLGSKNKLS
jgi:O-antigen/teichoic acid export membrane protein